MKTGKPRILLSVKTKKENYITAVEENGGIAVAQYCPGFSDEYDGLVLCGGSDIDPVYYDEEINGSVGIDADRDKAEFALFERFIEAKKPVLGICRGCQLINIAFGGNLYQDLETASEHSSFSDYDLVHRIVTPEGSLLCDMYSSEFYVNSSHHQAIKKVGSGLNVSATTTDGKIIEGVVHDKLPIIGVQWHPERMCFNHKREDTVDGSKIFEFFIELCKNQMD